ELVLEEFEANCLVVALDRENLAKHAFQSGGRALLGYRLQLEEAIIGASLDIGQGRHFNGVANCAEVSDLLRVNDTFSRDGHNRCSSQKRVRRNIATRRWAQVSTMAPFA